MHIDEINIARAIVLGIALHTFWPHLVLALAFWLLMSLFIVPIFYR